MDEVHGSEEDTDEDVDSDYCDILPEALEKAKARGPRASVSAEAYGSFNRKGAFKPKVVPKDESAKETIRQKMS